MRATGWPRIIVCMAANAPDRAAVLEDVLALAQTSAPALERVERTLTDGYACALGIEAERLRLQRRLEERAAMLGDGSEPSIEEVSDLAQAVAGRDAELAELRGALAGLAQVAQRLRDLV